MATENDGLVCWNDTYQGCGGKIKGSSECAKIQSLIGMEASNAWVAEPKYDGIWAAAFTDNGVTRFLSRNNKFKGMPELCKILIPEGVILIGELAYGSQEANTRRSFIGHEFMDVFDIIKCKGVDLRRESLKSRMRVMDKLYYETGRFLWDKNDTPIDDPHWSNWFIRAPRWVENFDKHYASQPEGLVLKHRDDGAYIGGGDKNQLWVKAKKIFSNEYVILGWVKSIATTKSHEPMAESIVCGGWVPSTTVEKNEKVYARKMFNADTAGNRREFSLIPLVKVGAMSHDMCKSVAQHFGKWVLQVIEINHYKLFESGSCRHPSVATLADGSPKIRYDKSNVSCQYRV